MECQYNNVYRLPGRTFFRIPWALSAIKVMFFCDHSAIWATEIIWSLTSVCSQRFWPVTLKPTFPGNSQRTDRGIWTKCPSMLQNSTTLTFQVLTLYFKSISIAVSTKGDLRVSMTMVVEAAVYLCQEPHLCQLWVPFCVKCADPGAGLLGSKHWLLYFPVLRLVVCSLLSKIKILHIYFTGSLWG